MSDHIIVDSLNKLTDEEMLSIIGGINISGTLIKSFTSAIEIVLDIGRSLGTAIRRLGKKGICSLK